MAFFVCLLTVSCTNVDLAHFVNPVFSPRCELVLGRLHMSMVIGRGAVLELSIVAAFFGSIKQPIHETPRGIRRSLR